MEGKAHHFGIEVAQTVIFFLALTWWSLFGTGQPPNVCRSWLIEDAKCIPHQYV